MGSLIRKWFVHCHGEGEQHQADIYRCTTCGQMVTWNKIQSGNVCCGGRVRPSSPRFLEAIRLLVFPWSV